jgi:hypothetical protein
VYPINLAVSADRRPGVGVSQPTLAKTVPLRIF